MGEDAFGGADEVWAASRIGREGDDDDTGVGEGDVGGDGGPAGEWRALQMEEAEDAAEEAFDAGAFAEFMERPGRRQAGAVPGAFGVAAAEGGRG
jgi:hypothetical protein